MDINEEIDDCGSGTIFVPGISRPVELCAGVIADEHARAFIDSFVPRSARERWLDLLVSGRAEWSRRPRGARGQKAYLKVCALLDAYLPQVGGSLPPRPDATSRVRTQAEHSGALIYPDIPTCYVTPAEALALFIRDDSSMILSLKQGVHAIVFCHGGSVFECKK